MKQCEGQEYVHFHKGKGHCFTENQCKKFLGGYVSEAY